MPSKVICFTCTALKEACLTQDNGLTYVTCISMIQRASITSSYIVRLLLTSGTSILIFGLGLLLKTVKEAYDSCFFFWGGEGGGGGS